MNVLYFFTDLLSKIVSMDNLLPIFVLSLVGLIFVMIFKMGKYDD